MVPSWAYSFAEFRGWGGGTKQDSQQRQSLETSDAILLSGGTKIQSRALASCGPEIIGISVGNFFSFPCIVIHI